MVRQPRYYQTDAGKHDRWLISYVDIVTILLILFVAVAAHSVQNAQAQPAPEQKTAIRPVQPPPPPPSLSPALVAARERLERHGISVEVHQRGLIVSLPQAVLFASGDDGLSSSAQPVISGIADVLRDIPSHRVTLIGHADAKPIHGTRFRNNWELSAARSLKILDALTTRYGISEERLSLSSEGSHDPKGSNETEDGRAVNRRVEISIQSAE